MTQTYEASTDVEIEAAPEAVWQALTDPALIAPYMHGTAVNTDWVEDSPIIWRGEWEGGFSHWSPLTGKPDEPAEYHHVRYDIEQLGEGRTRLTLTRGNSRRRKAPTA